MPEIIIHRVNEQAKLKEIPPEFGVEIDLRAEDSSLILHHDPMKGGEFFHDWLDDFRHGLLVLNIKEAGIESEAIRLLEQRKIKDFFLLDVEFPYIYRASRMGERRIAIRYSEDEAIETLMKYQGRVDWAWVDTITTLPLDARIVEKLSSFRTCLVCPERWGRAGDISMYKKTMRQLGFRPSAVMTSLQHASQWKQEE